MVAYCLQLAWATSVILHWRHQIKVLAPWLSADRTRMLCFLEYVGSLVGVVAGTPLDLNRGMN